MNKQEVMKEINNLPKYYANGACVEFEKVSKLINQLDEPEKPVVPQFVADWYEEHKINFEFNLYRFCVDFHESELPENLHVWFISKNNRPIQTLVNMHQFGYEAEKEKLYTVEIPNPNGGTYLALCKDVDGKLFFDAFFSEEWKTFGKCKLTESEIKEGFAWAWQFAVEVKE